MRDPSVFPQPHLRVQLTKERALSLFRSPSLSPSVSLAPFLSSPFLSLSFLSPTLSLSPPPSLTPFVREANQAVATKDAHQDGHTCTRTQTFHDQKDPSRILSVHPFTDPLPPAAEPPHGGDQPRVAKPTRVQAWQPLCPWRLRAQAGALPPATSPRRWRRRRRRRAVANFLRKMRLTVGLGNALQLILPATHVRDRGGDRWNKHFAPFLLYTHAISKMSEILASDRPYLLLDGEGV